MKQLLTFIAAIALFQVVLVESQAIVLDVGVPVNDMSLRDRMLYVLYGNRNIMGVTLTSPSPPLPLTALNNPYAQISATSSNTVVIAGVGFNTLYAQTFNPSWSGSWPKVFNLSAQLVDGDDIYWGAAVSASGSWNLERFNILTRTRSQLIQVNRPIESMVQVPTHIIFASGSCLSFFPKPVGAFTTTACSGLLSYPAMCISGTTVYVGQSDQIVKQYEVSGLSLTWTKDFVGYSGNIRTIECNERYVFVGGDDATIRMWDVNALQFARDFVGHSGSIVSLIFVNQTLYSGSSDGTVRRWSIVPFSSTTSVSSTRTSTSSTTTVSSTRTSTSTRTTSVTSSSSSSTSRTATVSSSSRTSVTTRTSTTRISTTTTVSSLTSTSTTIRTRRPLPPDNNDNQDEPQESPSTNKDSDSQGKSSDAPFLASTYGIITIVAAIVLVAVIAFCGGKYWHARKRRNYEKARSKSAMSLNDIRPAQDETAESNQHRNYDTFKRIAARKSQGGSNGNLARNVSGDIPPPPMPPAAFNPSGSNPRPPRILGGPEMSGTLIMERDPHPQMAFSPTSPRAPQGPMFQDPYQNVDMDATIQMGPEDVEIVHGFSKAGSFNNRSADPLFRGPPLPMPNGMNPSLQRSPSNPSSPTNRFGGYNRQRNGY